jgi:hypothetical protein
MAVEHVNPEGRGARVRRWFNGGPLPKVLCRYEDGTKRNRWCQPEELELVHPLERPKALLGWVAEALRYARTMKSGDISWLGREERLEGRG